MGKAEPTPAGLRAAREALRKNPSLARAKTPDQALHDLACWHNIVGGDRFELHTGLRKPSTPIEVADFEFTARRITIEQYRAAIEEEITRPVDDRMVRCFYDDLEQKVVSYGRAIAKIVNQGQMIQNGDAGTWNEKSIELHLQTLFRKFNLSGEELQTFDEFVSEARSERGLALLQIGDLTAHSVGLLVGMASERLEQLVQWDAAKQVFSGDLDQAFHAAVFGRLPPAVQLQAMLHQEKGVVRSVLRARTLPSLPVTVKEISMSVETCNMTANVVNMNTPAKSNPSPSAAKLRVERWSQLGIGLDGNGVLAFIQAPEFGAAVRKKDGVPLDLTGRRWAVVLDLASRSTDGRTILRRELLQRLGKDAGPSRPTASASSAAAEGLTESSRKTAAYLASLFSELRGDLDKCIAGPGDGSAARFRESVGEIDLGFVVRPLLEDDSRHCTFGAPSL